MTENKKEVTRLTYEVSGNSIAATDEDGYRVEASLKCKGKIFLKYAKLEQTAEGFDKFEMLEEVCGKEVLDQIGEFDAADMMEFLNKWVYYFSLRTDGVKDHQDPVGE